MLSFPAFQTEDQEFVCVCGFFVWLALVLVGGGGGFLGSLKKSTLFWKNRVVLV